MAGILPSSGYKGPAGSRGWLPLYAALGLSAGFGASALWPIRAAAATGSAPVVLAGDCTALAGSYLLMVMVVLMARIPAIERVLGADQLNHLHRRLSPAPLLLLGAHLVLTTVGSEDRNSVWSAFGTLFTTEEWIPAAMAAYVMLVVIAAASVRLVRRRMNYDRWWVLHLYTYLAMALAIPHQIFDGTNFSGHPLMQGLWLALWLATAGTVIVYRVGVPVARSLCHRLRVAEVIPVAPGIFSVFLEGDDMERFAAVGGQWVSIRVLQRGWWWHAHPFSLSELPKGRYLRFTVKVVGDTTAHIARLAPGTPVAIEGPYGAFTYRALTHRRVALIGAGVGVTPIRALLEDTPPGVDVVVVQRASRPEELVHRAEIRALIASHHGRLETLTGPRHAHTLERPESLGAMLPDLAERDLYICGPQGFIDSISTAAEALGAQRSSIHTELFSNLGRES